MAQNSLQGFDFEDFLKTDEHNRDVSLELLKSKDYWKQFTMVTDIYGHFQNSFSISNLKTHSGLANHYLYGGCLVNLVKSISNILSGHITDSHIYGRRTIEIQKIAIYLREHPTEAEEWLKTREQKSAQKFKEKVGKWYQKDGGKFFKTEMPGSHIALNAANIVGPHTNLSLLLFQNRVEKIEDTYTSKVIFHELSPGIQGEIFLLDRYFWHLNIHFWTVFWWIEKSGIEYTINPDLKKFWQESRNDFDRALDRFIKESNRVWPMNSPSPKS